VTQRKDLKMRWLALWGLLIAFVAVAMAPRTAYAQVVTAGEPVGVVDFVGKNGVDNAFGVQAAQAVLDVMEDNPRFQMETLDRAYREMEDLGLVGPLESTRDLIRLGQAMEVGKIVHGEVYAARITEVGNGKRAEVSVRVLMTSVASGRVVNGAAVAGTSAVRDNSFEDEQLLSDAFAAMAFDAMSQISSRTLPNAAVLNVLGGEVLLNRGETSGLKQGMTLIITRGDQLVADATVSSTDADSAYVRVTRSYVGVRPGDKAEPLFTVPIPQSTINPDGSVKTRNNRSGGNNNAVIGVVVLLVVAGLLFGQGRGSNNVAANNVTVEALTVSANNPGVKISWKRDAFFRGTQSGFAWQVYRNNNVTPVAVVAGAQSFAFDDLLGTNAPNENGIGMFSGAELEGGITCNDVPSTDVVAPTPIALGERYTYFVESIYRVSPNDLPGDGGGGGGGGGTTGGGLTTGGSTGTTTGGGTTGTTTGTTTGGGTTGSTTGSTTGGTTGGGGTSGAQWCYFISGRQPSNGSATPLNSTELVQPIDGETVAIPRSVLFRSVRGANPTIQIEYVVQVSDVSTFPSGRTQIVSRVVDRETATGATITTPAIDFSQAFSGAAQIYYRVGVKAVGDEPGPVMDASGERYIFSGVRLLNRPVVP